MGRRQRGSNLPTTASRSREFEPALVTATGVVRPIEVRIGDYPSEVGRVIRTFEPAHVTNISRFLGGLNSISPNQVSLAVFGNSFLLDSVVREDRRAEITDILSRAAEIDFSMPSSSQAKSLLGNLASSSKKLSVYVTGTYVVSHGQQLSEGVFTADRSEKQTRIVQNVGDLKDFRDEQGLAVSIGLRVNEENLN